MSKINTTFTLFVLALFSLPALLSFGIRYLPVESQPPLGATERFYGNKFIEGKVLSPDNNLNGVGLSFKNPNLQNKEEVVLNITKETGELVRTAVLSGRSVPDGGFVRFMFEPIADSRGGKYDYALSSPSSAEAEALEVYLSKDSSSPASVIYYKPVSRAVLLKDIYSSWMARFWEDKAFAVFYLGIIFLGFGYVAFGKDRTI